MAEFDAWIGREERLTDRVDPEMVARWCATLDRAPPVDTLAPQGVHWCLALPRVRTAELGEDGHVRRDDSLASFLPPVDLPRRMWASSTVEFLRPLKLGEIVSRRSVVRSITPKAGGSGRLCFVDVAHESSGEEGVAVKEVQSIVYREPSTTGAPPSPPPLGEGRFDPSAWRATRILIPGQALLFRFSALTFNSHRIHYDLPYARAEEGYRNLVVHGPLIATLLLDLVRRELGEQALSRFSFRGVSPAMHAEPLHLVLRGSGKALELGAFADDGRQVMSASAEVRS